MTNIERTKAVTRDGTDALVVLVDVFSGLVSKKKAEGRCKDSASDAEHEQNVINR